MAELTIKIPDELMMRLQPVQDRLPEVIELGLRVIVPSKYKMHSEVIEFLATGPTPPAIVAFRPSKDAQSRVAELLYRNSEGTLTDEEEAELDQYEALDFFMTLVKARARGYVDDAQ